MVLSLHGPDLCCGVAARHTKASGHSGILESAKAVVEDLQSTGVLEGLMLHPPVPHPSPPTPSNLPPIHSARDLA